MTSESGESRTAPSEAGAPLPVGRVGRPHGLDGSFYVTRPQARLLTLGAELTVAGWSAQVVRRAGTDQRPIVRLGGIEDRTGAEELRGLELTVDSRRAPALDDGEWWAHELEGCVVRDGERLLGTVIRLIKLPSCEALEVRPAQGGEPVLVPLVKDAVRTVDPAAQQIEVDLEFLNFAPPRAQIRERGDRRGQGCT